MAKAAAKAAAKGNAEGKQKKVQRPKQKELSPLLLLSPSEPSVAECEFLSYSPPTEKEKVTRRAVRHVRWDLPKSNAVASAIHPTGGHQTGGRKATDLQESLHAKTGI